VIGHAPVPTADELGLMTGAPPPPDRLVTLANWIDPPFNRWSLLHFQEVVPGAPVSRGTISWDLSPDPHGLGDVGFTFEGASWTLDEMLAATATDGIAVLHDGSLVWERYLNAMTPTTRHLCFSVSKSVVVTLAGILIDRGLIDPIAHVPDVIPELAGTSWEGATVQHVMDMRTGHAFHEVYQEVGGDADMFGQVLGWFPRTDPLLPPDTYSYLAGLPADREHGGVFDYRTPLTSMLGWLCERAAGERLPALLSREVWAPMGAESDATIAVDAVGNAFGGGGICATLRDLARFGELWRTGGVMPDGTRIVPADFVTDTLAGGADSRAAYAAQIDFEPDPDFPDAFYRNQWWIYDPERPLYSAIGIHGQYVTIDGAAGLVVARFSSLPAADDEESHRLHTAAVRAIAATVNGG
jgi:CubicO group peptidase (beta-lactamase class C family)